MCGLAGIIGPFSKSSNRKVLNRMLCSIKHRGPDFTGEWIDREVALGHNRLGIIDLTEDGNQPFISNCGNYILVFNGEIYNYLELKNKLNDYQFKSQTDSEVILAAFLKWGKACVHYFIGMFSFAIWDVKNKSLFASRDRFGVKPFYYWNDGSSFLFSSEIKALHNSGIPRSLKKEVWSNYFAYGSYGMPNETFWESIHQIPAGHSLEYNDCKLKLNPWYVFEEEIKKYQCGYSAEDAKKKYTELLKDSIDLRFRSDLSVGFNVSGGLDSSALLSLVNLRDDSEKINAYTFYTNNSDYDELPWVEEMISITNNPLKKVLLENDVEIISKINEVAKFQDEPFGGIPTVAYNEIFKQARKDEVIVLLDGQGMDEQWAGYDYYTQDNQNTIQGIRKSPFKPHVLSDEFINLAKAPIYPKPFKDELLNKQFRDLFYTKIPRALRFNDRISMSNSTELREPFLDHRLVEFAFAQPIVNKIKNGVHKYLLREIVSEFLSDDLSFTPKRPLQTPQREWLANELRSLVNESIKKIKNSEVSYWFNFEEMDKEWNSYINGNRDSSFHIWQWINLAMIL